MENRGGERRRKGRKRRRTLADAPFVLCILALFPSSEKTPANESPNISSTGAKRLTPLPSLGVNGEGGR